MSCKSELVFSICKYRERKDCHSVSLFTAEHNMTNAMLVPKSNTSTDRCNFFKSLTIESNLQLAAVRSVVTNRRLLRNSPTEKAAITG